MVRDRTMRAEPERTVVDDLGREFIARRHRFPANGTGFMLAPVLWMVYFVAVYALQGAGCAAHLDAVPVAGTSVLRLALALLTGVVAAVLAATGVWSFVAWRRLLEALERSERRAPGYGTFLAYGALLHAGLFLVATLWIGIPILLLDVCNGLGTT